MAGSVDEGRAFAVGVLTVGVAPAGGEGDVGMQGVAGHRVLAFHREAEPLALAAPGFDAGAVQRGLLGGQGGGDQVVDQAQGVGAVARAHQLAGAAGDGAGMQAAAAVGQWLLAAARAVRGLQAHRLTTSTCRSSADSPRTGR